MDFYLNDAAFDSSRAQEMLEWRPQVDLREGLAATLASLRSMNPNAVSVGTFILVAMTLLSAADTVGAMDAAHEPTEPPLSGSPWPHCPR
jgi:hypothetical protein